jgi:anaerobic selenocysteine-containing dehydrogenase
MEISRREFLRLLGISSAGVSLGSLGCDATWSVPDELYETVGGAPRIETWKTSLCTLCPGGCGIKVRLIDGIPVRILGNPLHPVNRGGVCPMADVGVEALFNPDRIKEPLKRVGARGEDKWEPVSWDEAIQMVVSRLQSLREKNETHKLAFFSGNANNLFSSLLERFMEAFGSPNLYAFDENVLPTLVTYLTQGHKSPLSYNFENIKLLINFGADFLDEGPSPVRLNQLYSEFRNRGEGRNVRIVHIDSRQSRTAAVSHEWLPVKPGTMAALALGIANVLIQDGQYDRGFIAANSFGFDDWEDAAGNFHKGFKSLVEEDYYPEKVAKITDIPPRTIVELARTFGTVESALVLAGGQAINSSNGLYTLWAIECLNVLKGNYGDNGNISISSEPPFAELPPTKVDDVAAKGLLQPKLIQSLEDFCFTEHAVSLLPRMILEHRPYPLDVLFLANVNPLFNSTNQNDVAAALEEIPFIVSFGSYLDETTLYADLILPDHIFLEKLEVVHSVTMVPFSHLGMQQPVIEPLYNTRHQGDVILQIAQKLGGTVASSCTWSDYKAFIQFHLKGIYERGVGTIFTERMDDAWLRFLKERGWQIFDYTTFEEFWQVLLDNGGWWDPFPSATDFRTMFATPSKRLEFFSQLLQDEIRSQTPGQAPQEEMYSLLAKWKIEARGDLAFLPHHEPARFNNGSSEFVLHLLPYRLITNANGQGCVLPMMQELFGMLAREYWASWIEINPDTARKYAIKDEDMVKVISPKGSLEVKAKLLPTIKPEVVYIPFGLGHKAYGRYAKGIGVNPYEILTEDYDSLSGELSLVSTKVAIEKVAGKEQA